jgi:hypothetical protein
MGGIDATKVAFIIFLIIGTFIAAFVPPLGVGLIMLGAKITNV